jgi:hypothetical protein
VKTARFEYTHMSEVDSSLAQALYYNADEKTLALEFHSNVYDTPSAIYGEVPQAFYEGLLTVDSLGKVYNTFIKKTFPNVSEGTVYDVEYVDASARVSGEKTPRNTYMVKGYIRYQDTFEADSLEGAREQFLDTLTGEGYDGNDLAVTEVYILESGS